MVVVYISCYPGISLHKYYETRPVVPIKVYRKDQNATRHLDAKINWHTKRSQIVFAFNLLYNLNQLTNT